MSTGIPEWESLINKTYCSQCASEIDFTGECSECKEPWSVNEWGT